jgi:hypothetical protein
MDPLTAKGLEAAAGQLVPEARGLLNRLLGPAADELGGMLREWVISKRRQNLSRIAAKAAAMVPDGANDAPRLSTRTVVALLEQASLEDEGAGLDEEWAGLLASAVTGVDVPSAYPAILSQMTPRDAKLLNTLAGLHEPAAHLPRIGFLGNATGLSGDELMEAIDSLLRLRLCALTIPQTGEVVRRSDLWPMEESALEITVLGRQFLRACRGPK